MIKKGILNQLIQTHDLKSLEQHLVFSYLTDNKIDYSKNSILKQYFLDFEQNTKLILTLPP